MIQIEFHEFPKSRRKYIFSKIELIDVVFSLEKLNIDIEKAKKQIEDGGNYNNSLVTIKKVTPQKGTRVCVENGITDKNKILIKWVNI